MSSPFVRVGAKNPNILVGLKSSLSPSHNTVPDSILSGMCCESAKFHFKFYLLVLNIIHIAYRYTYTIRSYMHNNKLIIIYIVLSGLICILYRYSYIALNNQIGNNVLMRIAYPQQTLYYTYTHSLNNILPI